ncbi:MAG: type II toxin-antitoxin system RelE/ParE family toxin [Deltaproteobacteria bacterium]|nr:type II toxin-antitoxin system RelE/ParE family toxin [Deltaproteobacteria bacterium]
MIRRLRVRPEAQEEILAAAEWYETRRPGLGVDLVAALDEAFEELQESATRDPTWRAGFPYRRRSLRGFPYLIFYLTGDDIEVVAVAHARRRPGYWVDRSGPGR